MPLSFAQFKPIPKGTGNAPTVRRDVPLARATFFGSNGPETPKQTPLAEPTTISSMMKGNLE